MITMRIPLASLEKTQTDLPRENKYEDRNTVQLKWGWLLEKQLKYERKHTKLLYADSIAGIKHTSESRGFSLYMEVRLFF